MRVLVVAPQPFFAERGTPMAVRRLVETLCEDDHRVDLLTYPFGEDVEMEGLSLHRCRRFPGVREVGIGFSLSKVLLDLMLLPRLFRLAAPGRYDVVHAVEESIYFALLLRWRHRAAVIYDMDSSPTDQLTHSHRAFRLVKPLLTRLEEWAIRSADVVAPMCEALADFAANVRDNADQVVLHDVPTVQISEARARVVPAPDRGGRPVRALYVGNLEAYQGIDLLVDALGHLPVDAPLSIRVVGGPIEEAERFRSIVEESGERHRIEFVGPRPVAQLERLLTEADILLSPRTAGENTPLKIYSYMESGRPILATRLKTHTQVLDDSTAMLVDPSPGAYARGLMRLAEDERLRKNLGKAARARVRRRYSLSNFVRRVREIYGSSGGRGRRQSQDPVQTESTTWNGVERRSPGDRRSGVDRRSAPRAGSCRRVSERRSFVYA